MLLSFFKDAWCHVFIIAISPSQYRIAVLCLIIRGNEYSKLQCIYTRFYCPLTNNVFIILFVWSERREDGIIAKRKEWEKCNFPLFGGKEKWVYRLFHLGSPFFFSLQIREKGEQMTLKKEVQIYPNLFHSSTFNNKRLITIYILYFHFSILLPTTHIWWKTHFLSFQFFILPTKQVASRTS